MTIKKEEETLACNIAKLMLLESKILPIDPKNVIIRCKLRSDMNEPRNYGLHFEFNLNVNQRMQICSGTIIAQSEKKYEKNIFQATSFEIIINPNDAYHQRKHFSEPTILKPIKTKIKPNTVFEEEVGTFIFKDNNELHIELEEYKLLNLIDQKL